MLNLPPHDDVVFGKAPLVAVRCAAQFPSVLSLMTQAGIAGLQEALRGDYPVYEEQQRATFTFKNELGIEHKPPVHTLKSQSESWAVSVTTTSVELKASGNAYTTSAEFVERFHVVAEAVARTISPDSTRQLHLVKENFLTHPSVSKPADWLGLLSGSIVSPYEQFGSLVHSTSQLHGRSFLHIHGDDDILEVEYGSELSAPNRFALNISRWTERPYDLGSTEKVIAVLRQFAADATGVFHLLLEEPMKAYLEPAAR